MEATSGFEDDDELSESESELKSDCRVAVFRAVGTWPVCPLLSMYRDCRGAGTGLSVRCFRVRSLGRGLDVGSKGRVLMAPEEAPPTKDGDRAVEKALLS